MSKITICEGNIKWTSKGNTVLHAFDGDISFSAGECNIWNGEQGNETGEYIAEAVGGQYNKPCFLLFFRSKKQMQGFPRKNVDTTIEVDTDYKGDFGFDNASLRLYQHSTEIKNSYQPNRLITTSIDGKMLSEEDYTLKKVGISVYNISSLCLMKGKEASLYFKVFRSKKEKISTEIAFKLVEVNEYGLPNKSTIEYDTYKGNEISIVKIDERREIITLKANADFDTPIALISYYKNEIGEELIIGQCNLKPNRPLEMFLKFIKIKIEDIYGKPMFTETHPFDMNALETYLNTQTLNQAGIQVVIPNQTVDTLILKDTPTFRVFDFIKEVNLTSSPKLQTVFNRKKVFAIDETKKDATDDLDKSITNLFYEFLKMKFLTSSLFSSIFAKYKNILDVDNEGELVEILCDLYKYFFTPVFLWEDVTDKIDLSTENFGIAFEMSPKGYAKKVHMTKYALMNGKECYSIYAHELGHALSLEHPFQNDSQKGLTLENIMDYFSAYISTDTNNNKTVKQPNPNVFVQQQWEKARDFLSKKNEVFEIKIRNNLRLEIIEKVEDAK